MIVTKETYNGLLKFRTTSWYIGDALEKYGEYSPEEVDLLKVLAKGRNVIVAGANIGAIAVPVAKVAKTIHLFEPNPTEFSLLGMNIIAAGVGLSSCHNQALGAKAGTLYCRTVDPEQEGNIGGLSLLGWTSQDETVEVDVVTVDYFGIKDFGLLVADVEGMEIHVVQGAIETIKRCQPYLYLEAPLEDVPTDAMNPYGRKCRTVELFKLIDSLGYIMYYHLPPITPKAVEGDRFFNVCSFNVLCVPNCRGFEFAKLRQDGWKLIPVKKVGDGQFVIKDERKEG